MASLYSTQKRDIPRATGRDGLAGRQAGGQRNSAVVTPGSRENQARVSRLFAASGITTGGSRRCPLLGLGISIAQGSCLISPIVPRSSCARPRVRSDVWEQRASARFKIDGSYRLRGDKKRACRNTSDPIVSDALASTSRLTALGEIVFGAGSEHTFSSYERKTDR